MIPYTPPKAATRIPVIDLAPSFAEGPGRAAVAQAIHRACRETGFFYVAGHGVDPALVEGQIEAARRFFALDDTAKRAVDRSLSPCWRGYEGVGAQVLDSGSAPDHKESFAIAVDLPPDDPLVLAGVPGQGPNQWPADLPGFRAQMLAYQAAMIALGRHLMGLLAQSVELPFGYFDAGLGAPQCGVRLLRYPPQPEGAAGNLLGAGAHTDWGSITILLQDGQPGLEVCNADGEWILATPIPGTFVINIGQMMERFTAGVYRANLHRVRNGARAAPRYSVATFFELEPLYRMDRAPSCPPNPAFEALAGLTVSDHIEQMARASYAAA
ncbi:isopenicillin N synthase family dioxygenase [Sphingomonas sp. CJ20]